MKKIREKLFCRKGQSLVETALVLPIVLIIVFGIIEFGRIFNAYLIVSSAVREGARYAAVGHSGLDVETLVNDRASSLGTITVLVNPQDARNQGDRVAVTGSYDMPLVTPIIGPLISESNSFHIESTTAMRVE